MKDLEAVVLEVQAAVRASEVDPGSNEGKAEDDSYQRSDEDSTARKHLLYSAWFKSQLVCGVIAFCLALPCLGSRHS